MDRLGGRRNARRCTAPLTADAPPSWNHRPVEHLRRFPPGLRTPSHIAREELGYGRAWGVGSAGSRCGGRYAALTFGMISSARRLRSSMVLEVGTSRNGGHRSGIVIPASL